MKRAFSIKWQLMGICIVLVSLPVMLLGIISVKSSENEIQGIIEGNTTKQAIMAVDEIKMAFGIIQEQVNTSLNVARNELYSVGDPYLEPDKIQEMRVVNQITKETKTISIPAMKINEEQIAFNYKIVDRIKELVGGTATIFQMIPDGALRISTNVMTKDNKRAVGTFIPANSAVYKTIKRGKTFFGRAYVVNDWYQTAYEPIKDQSGKIIGALYFGAKDASEPILDSLSKVVVGKTGYIYILNEKGDYVLSYKRQRDGENIMEAKDANGNFFIKEIVQRGLNLNSGETAVTYYPWKNQGEGSARMKIAGYAFFPDWNWVVASSAYYDDFSVSVNKIRNHTILIILIAILSGSVIAYFFSLMIIKPVKRVLSVIDSTAKGDLNDKIGLESRVIEFNDIACRFDNLVDNLRDTVQLANKIADGDLSVTVKKLSEQDSFGSALENMVKSVSDLVSKIRLSADSVSAGTQQVSESSQSLSQGATEQAASIEEINASVTHLSSQTKTNAENASQANQLAATARKTAEIGNTQMAGMISAMGDIAESSKEIEKIIKTIDDVAFQTNLLALNAAVEAARAGKHGKGFAVVAQEVRDLAVRSAKAARETTTLIEGAGENVKKGSDIVNQTAEALREIFQVATKVSYLVGEISAASDEQAQGIGQINTGLGQVDQVTQLTTANAEETASAAEELARQTEYMQQLLSRFQLKNSDAT